MKTRLNTVYNKLPNQKTSLSSVEEIKYATNFLGINRQNLDELSNAINSARLFESYLDEAKISADAFVEEYDSIVADFYDSNASETVKEILDDFATNAEALGVDPNTVKEFSELESQFEDIKNFEDEVRMFVENYRGEKESADKIASM